MKKIFQNSQLVAFVILTILFIGHQTHAQRYPAVFDPVTIPFNGTNGFVVPGLYPTSKLGSEVQFIGDINNDGIEDIGIGDGNDDVGANLLAGRTFIIFGSSSGFPTPFDLSSLDGTNGFVVEGVAYNERRGSTIAGPGDINGDGIDDLIIGSSNWTTDEIVLYGATTFPPLITVNDINGTNGFLIDTPGSNQVAALGDVNSDGIGDFIIGTYHWSGGSWKGESWIMFGRTNNYPTLLDISWLDGINGFRTSSFPGTRSSYKVGGAGDINNDGYNDILIGNWSSLPGAHSYALFGKNTPFDTLVNIEAVDGTDGFFIDNSGNTAVTLVGPIGDINDDGIDDCFSENSIIFGSSTSFSDSLFKSDLNGSNGFLLQNLVLNAAPTGDLNLDGIDDFIVASMDNYVIFGTSAGFPSTFNSSILDGTNGFKIPIVAPAHLGRSIDGGKDFNGDGISDFIFGDLGDGTSSTGLVYVAFGGDFIAPTITCPANQELCAGAVIPDYTSLATAADNEDPNPIITQSPVAGSAFTNGMVITLTATDANNNASDCNFTINQIVDTTNPVITCPASQLLAFGATVLDYTGLATATDNCGVTPTITQSPLVGTAFTDGMSIILTATDGSGNTSNCSFIIDKLPDTIAPTITCPSTQELTCNDTVIPDYTGLATAADAEDPNPIITQNPVAGTAFTDGMVITLTATDASSNASSCTFTVNLLADTENPIITTCPANQLLAFGATILDYTGLATATDNCGVTPTITQSPLTGTAFTDGMSITLTVTDGSGNTSNCSFIISKLPDTIAPSISCPATQELTCNDTVIPDYNGLATATDAEDPNPVITQSPVAGTVFTDGMTITLTATDGSGNASSCTFTVNLLADTDNPIITTCPANQSLAFGAVIPDYTGLGTATDNCGVAPTITQNPLVGTAFTNGMSITLTATDGSGNTSNCSFIINKLPDTTAPIIICPANQELCAGAVIPDYTGLSTATDAEDSNPIITQNPVAGTAFTDGMAITLTATDGSGNASSCNFTVTKLLAPSVSASATATTVCVGEEVTLTSSGNAESYRWNNGVTDGVAFVPNATTTYTVIGTDANGCEASAQITIAVNSVPAQPTIAVNGDILTSSSAIGNQWFMDGAAINGAIEQSYTISTGSAVYTVQAIADGCTSDMSDPVIITGLNKLVANNTLTIWPNPVTNQLFVQLPGTSMVYHYLIINSIGTIVKSGKFKKTELVQHFDVALQELRSGTYAIQVFTSMGLIQAKFVKQ